MFEYTLADAVLLCSVERNFRMENIQFSSRRFFSPAIAHDAQSLQVCRVVGVSYHTSVGCHRGLEAGSGGFEFRYRPYFFTSF